MHKPNPVIRNTLSIPCHLEIERRKYEPLDKSARESGVKAGNWINGGVTYNFNPANGYNGTVTFAERANRLQPS